MTATGHNVSEDAVHHAPLHSEVDDGLFVVVVDAGEFGLFTLFLDDLHLLHQLGGKVAGGHLRVIQEEGFPGDGNPGDGFSVGGDGAVICHLDAGELLQQVDEHVVVRDLVRGRIILHRIFLDDNGVAGGRHGGGVQHFLVHVHLEGAQVHVTVPDQNLMRIGLVSQEFRLEGIFAGADLLHHRLSLRVCQGVFGVSPFGNQGHCRKPHGFIRCGIGQFHRNLVILSPQREGRKQADKSQHKSSCHKVLIHFYTLYAHLDTVRTAKFKPSKNFYFMRSGWSFRNCSHPPLPLAEDRGREVS